ncbi:DUF676-domain-containing protein [Thelephora ganbajun]|uniref:DUF676-domain-containing protein n=1 Tax=Thelephora ganbajun TaxID=370292 RepID=A0ACB6ZL16_THEGA|nr:DUF676-domain-containing protein [Thelephora ganbajun]
MTTDVHLLVLVHGMWGNPGHLTEMGRKIRGTWLDMKDSFPGEFCVLLANTNADDYTYDGVDHGGERVAEEVFEEVEKLKQRGLIVTKFSVTGYSLGGLVSRYLIGVLHQRKFFENVTPVNFNTFATPHIGLLRYPNFFSAIANSLGPRLLSRTGEQFFAVDKWSPSGRPLLAVMADPDRVFYQALELFPHKTIYANAINDLTVPYVTAAIEAEDPFLNHAINGIDIIFHEDYPNVIKSWDFPTDASLPRHYTPREAVPFLPIRFPYNLIVYLSLPILVPTVLGIVYARVLKQGRESRKRVEEIEKGDSYSSKLIHAVAELERQMEDQVTEFIDTQTGPVSQEKPSKEKEEDKWHSSRAPSPDPSSETLSITETDSKAEGRWNSKYHSRKKPQPKMDTPALLDVQREMIERLNKLTGLKKERAFYDDTRNSHASIVCRGDRGFNPDDVDSSLRHWADRFVF